MCNNVDRATYRKMQTHIKHLSVNDEYWIFELLNTLCEFGIETNYNQYYTDTVDQDNKILNDIYILLHDIDTSIIILHDDKEIHGFSIVSTDKLFRIDEGLGIIVKFYVRKQYRGSVDGYRLTAASIAWFKDKGITQSFCTSTGNIGIPSSAFENLFSKFNYQLIGKCLTRLHE